MEYQPGLGRVLVSDKITLEFEKSAIKVEEGAAQG
ncbi:hypothetical protein ABIB27_001613 [Arthrobacter sp. UYEF21]